MATTASAIVPEELTIIQAMGYPELWSGPEGWDRIPAAFVYRHLWFFILVGVLYIPSVLGLKAFMKNRPAFDLRRPLMFWNIAMATFSFFGFVNIYAPLFNAWIYPGTMTIYDGVCSTWCYHFGAAARWVFLFNLSKILEFVDTYFILLRKRPLPFLHWYHHIVTYSFCMYAGQVNQWYNCGGYIFSLMNFGVHSIMYTYYALRAAGFQPPIDKFITTLQILQMIAGTISLVISTQCSRVDLFGSAFGLTIYVTFFYLFARLFKRRYVDGEKPHKE
jgi:elongation of very long chain fatty acids protein 6